MINSQKAIKGQRGQKNKGQRESRRDDESEWGTFAVREGAVFHSHGGGAALLSCQWEHARAAEQGGNLPHRGHQALLT